MRAELDLLLTHGAAAHGRRVRPAGASDMEHEFSQRVASRRSSQSLLGARIEVRAMNAIGRRAELACRLAELRRLAERPKRDQR